jgi:peptidoglycan hydrolase CwlO-like protein
MNWLKNSRQRVVGIFALLLLVIMLAACGTPANAANGSSSQGSGVHQQTQQTQPTQTTTSGTSGTDLRSIDQQVQSLLRQLDGAQSDVNNADSGASQDSGQP